MKTIEKKIWPEYFEAVSKGAKNFEFRLADWNVEAGDILILKEWDPNTKIFTGRELSRKVSYVLKTKSAEDWGMWSKEEIEKYGFQVISFRPEEVL